MNLKGLFSGISNKFSKKNPERSTLQSKRPVSPDRDDEKENLKDEKVFKSPAYLSYWMSKLPDHMKLRNLILPGTHSSNSNSLKKPKLSVPFSQCQKTTLVEQLKMGVRFFDMRYGQVPPKKMKKLGLTKY